MKILELINFQEVLACIWSAIILPVITYIGREIYQWLKSKKLGKYAEILETSMEHAVKEIYESVVKDIKHTELWTKEKQDEVKEMAKQKAIEGLSNTMYNVLKQANGDFEEYLDTLVGKTLYDLKKY